MELKDFVAQTLCQICEGIKEAQNSVSTEEAIISPSCKYHTNDGLLEIVRDKKMSSVPSEVRYDVAITASSHQEGGKSGEQKFSLQVLAAKIACECDNGQNKKFSNGNESVSHVAFSVRVLWPEQVIEHEDCKK